MRNGRPPVFMFVVLSVIDINAKSWCIGTKLA